MRVVAVCQVRRRAVLLRVLCSSTALLSGTIPLPTHITPSLSLSFREVLTTRRFPFMVVNAVAVGYTRCRAVHHFTSSFVHCSLSYCYCSPLVPPLLAMFRNSLPRCRCSSLVLLLRNAGLSGQTDAQRPTGRPSQAAVKPQVLKRLPCGGRHWHNGHGQTFSRGIQ